MARPNGGIIGPDNIPTGPFGSAKGVWKLSDAFNYQKQGIWPIALPGFQVQNSCRFDDGSSDYLSFTPSSAPTSSKIATISFWFKLSAINTNFNFFSANQTGLANPATFKILLRDANGRLELQQDDGSAGDDYSLRTNQLLRDASAWYHLVAAFDTTQATASNRIKLYINGSQVTSFSQENYPTQNLDLWLGDTEAHNIGRDVAYGSAYYDGYMAEFVYIDGQQLTPSSFGETDATTGNWVPKDASGLTFGTNGFYLKFQNSVALGTDSSGNGNNFTVNNLTSVDQSTDSPTNNFATMNPLLVTSSTPSFSNGNLTITTSALSTWQSAFSTLAVTKGKWYCEIKFETGLDVMLGIVKESSATNSFTAGNNYPGLNSGGYGYYSPNGQKYNNGSGAAYGNGYTTGDIIGIALDLDNNYLYFAKNGTWQNSGDPTSGATGTGGIDISSITSEPIYIGSGHWKTSSGTTQTFSNFGNPPYAANGYTDSSGLGDFSYEVPSGYKALCTKNLNLVG